MPRNRPAPGAAEWAALVSLTGPHPRAPTGPLDWDRLIDIALRHKALALLSNGIAKEGVEPPQAAREKLNAAARKTVTRSLALARETVLVARAFEQAGIAMTVLKGVPLSQAIHGRIDRRDPGDIDILIPPERLPDAAQVLASLGYHSGHTLLLATPRQRERLTRLHKDLEFFCPDRRIALECHWSLARGRAGMRMDNPDPPATAPVEIGGTAIRTLTPARTVVYLCAHGAVHYWLRLKWLNDLRWIFHDPRLIAGDWDSVAQKAQETGMTRVVMATARLVQAMDGGALPDGLRHIDTAPRQTERRAGAMLRYLTRTGGALTDPEPGMIARNVFLIQRLRAAARDEATGADILRQNWTPGVDDLMMADLPEALEWGYVPLRLMRIMRRGRSGAGR